MIGSSIPGLAAVILTRKSSDVRFAPQAAILIAAIGLFICTLVWRRFTAEAAEEDVLKSEG